MALQRAFRYCLFKTPKVNLDRIAKRQAIHVAFCDKDPEEDIPVKPLPQAAPGLAPAFGKTQESHGRHRYFNYSGRWKNGHMRGPMGTYHFADGSKYTGSWKDSLQCGPGITTITQLSLNSALILILYRCDGISEWMSLFRNVERGKI